MSSESIPSITVYNRATGKLYTSYESPCEPCKGVTCNCRTQYRSREAQGVAHLRYSQVLSVHTAREIAASYAKTIRADIQYLRQQITSHGKTIVNRWKKKSREKRAVTLLKAFPRIYPSEFAAPYITYDNGVMSDEGVVDWEKWHDFREAFLLPYVNLEALKNDPFKFLMVSGDCGNRPAVLKSWTSPSPRRTKSCSLEDIVKLRVQEREHFCYGGRSEELCSENIGD